MSLYRPPKKFSNNFLTLSRLYEGQIQVVKKGTHTQTLCASLILRVFLGLDKRQELRKRKWGAEADPNQYNPLYKSVCILYIYEEDRERE